MATVATVATDPITMLHIADDAQYPYPAHAHFIPILLTVATVAGLTIHNDCGEDRESELNGPPVCTLPSSVSSQPVTIDLQIWISSAYGHLLALS